MAEADPPELVAHGVPFGDAARFWIKLGFINFGGPAGQIAIMHDELVTRRRWISNGRFLHALSYCMLLPGPEAQQLAIYTGWLLHRVKGGLLAGIAFVLPSFFLMLGLSWVFAARGGVDWIQGIFSGLAAAVIAIVISAVIRIARRALANGLMVAVAVVSFVAIFLLHIPFPLIVAAAIVIGLIGGSLRPDLFDVGAATELEEMQEVAIRDDAPAADHTRPSTARAIVTLAAGLTAWLVPLALVAVWLGPSTPTEMGWFFSRAALVTFGGAYAVLAYIDQAAVMQFGWLLPGQMVVGLGLAESTPGPLIMVVEFVGFVGAYQNPGSLDPLAAGLVGATVATWATFAPCFLWIFLGAPFIERLRGNRRLSAALETVTAAIVGVIANLGVTFAITTLFERVRVFEVAGGPVPIPVWASVDPFAMVVAVVALVGMIRFRWSVITVVAGAALAGLTRAAIV